MLYIAPVTRLSNREAIISGPWTRITTADTFDNYIDDETMILVIGVQIPNKPIKAQLLEMENGLFLVMETTERESTIIESMRPFV